MNRGIYTFIASIAAILIIQSTWCACMAEEKKSEISLRETIKDTALYDLKNRQVVIKGSAADPSKNRVYLRVTNSDGDTYTSSAAVINGKFKRIFPSGFRGAKLSKPCMLFIDASYTRDFDNSSLNNPNAEAAVLVYDSKGKELPDMPTAFTNDLLDSDGKTDKSSKEWNAVSKLMNLYMKSKGAYLANVGRNDFDLANPKDFDYYKNNIALYDFDNRDRDWNTPLGNRPARNFWKSVWNTWFNSSNNHPLDGDKNNNNPSNYTPYAFSNDYSDILIMYIMRQQHIVPMDDNLRAMCIEGTRNLLAMQHKEPSNFALVDHRGMQENYTAGAFRYGMFVNGDYLTEGKGWFYNPAFLDYIHGGVLNGRCVWAMGEALKTNPDSPIADELKSAIALSAKFCLNDALKYGYAKKTANGNVYWRDAGEHAYLVIGLVAACSVDPDYIAFTREDGKQVSIRDAAVSSLNALTDLNKPHNQWEIYPNTDSMSIAALADGYELLKNHPDADKWLKTASDAADAWLNAKVPESEFSGTPVNFGLRIAPDEMTYNWSCIAPDGWKDRNFIFLYQTGHWIHALSRLYAATNNQAYLDRAEAMVSYLCGDNPFGVRLLNETGGVYNWVEDSNGDGVEDYMKQDMYPESTAFNQIGIMHLMRLFIK